MTSKYMTAHMCDIWWRAGRNAMEEYVLAPGQVALFTDLSRTLAGQAGFSIYSAVYSMDGHTGVPIEDTRWYTTTPGEALTLEDAVSDRSCALMGYGGGVRRYPMGDSPAGLFFRQPVNGWESLYSEGPVNAEPFVRAHIVARIPDTNGYYGPIDTSSITPVLYIEHNASIDAYCSKCMVTPVERWDVVSQRRMLMVPVPIPVLLEPVDTMLEKMGYSSQAVCQLTVNWRCMVRQFMRRFGAIRMYVGHKEDTVPGTDVCRRFDVAGYSQLLCPPGYGMNIVGGPPISLRKWISTPYDKVSLMRPVVEEAKNKVIECLRNRTFLAQASGTTL